MHQHAICILSSLNTIQPMIGYLVPDWSHSWIFWLISMLLRCRCIIYLCDFEALHILMLMLNANFINLQMAFFLMLMAWMTLQIHVYVNLTSQILLLRLCWFIKLLHFLLKGWWCLYVLLKKQRRSTAVESAKIWLAIRIFHEFDSIPWVACSGNFTTTLL